jgi:SAM-dependent methyltransferase
VTKERTPRSRFYDGPLYARLFDPFAAGLHRIVADHVGEGARVLDVGCGTGNLAIIMATRAAEVVGVELSPAMVDFASRRLEECSTSNVSIILGDVTTVFSDRPDDSFDIATMVLTLHEMPAETRVPVLREVVRLAAKVLCVDFRVPMPRNLAGLRNRLAEVAAGLEHLRAFRDFTRRGGIPGIAGPAGLQCRHRRLLDSQTMAICELSR